MAASQPVQIELTAPEQVIPSSQEITIKKQTEPELIWEPVKL